MVSVHSVRQYPNPKPADGVYDGTHDGSCVDFDTPQGKFRGETESRDSIWGKKSVKVNVKEGHATMVYECEFCGNAATRTEFYEGKTHVCDECSV
jgi:hypothetical protein